MGGVHKAFSTALLSFPGKRGGGVKRARLEESHERSKGKRSVFPKVGITYPGEKKP